jgi:hypothetical protein
MTAQLVGCRRTVAKLRQFPARFPHRVRPWAHPAADTACLLSEREPKRCAPADHPTTRHPPFLPVSKVSMHDVSSQSVSQSVSGFIITHTMRAR